MLAYRVVPLRELCITCYLPSRLGEDVLYSLVTFALFMWLETTSDPLSDPLSQACFSQTIYRIHLYGRCHTYFTKCLDIVTSISIYLVLFLREIYVCFTVHVGFSSLSPE